MALKVSTLRPGLLVSLNTSVRGGVAYRRLDIEPDHEENGERRAKWETTRTIEDPTGYEAALKVRSKCRSLIASVCCPSAFGLLCPADREEQLAAAIDEAKSLAYLHNKTGTVSEVGVYVITGRIAQDDVEAARAIASEIRDLMDDMERGISKADPEAIRAAANKARALGGMLTPEAAGKVKAAIEQAREAAREITKRVVKAGELAAAVVQECKTNEIAKARFAFLDLEGPQEVQAAPVSGRGVDLPSGNLVSAPVSLPAFEV